MSEALRCRVMPDELAALKAVAAREGVTVSRLLRRAVREMVTGGPDFFDDGTALMSELAHELAEVQRELARLDGGAIGSPALQRVLQHLSAVVESTRMGFAEQVKRSRVRWAPRTTIRQAGRIGK